MCLVFTPCSHVRLVLAKDFELDCSICTGFFNFNREGGGYCPCLGKGIISSLDQLPLPQILEDPDFVDCWWMATDTVSAFTR